MGAKQIIVILFIFGMLGNTIGCFSLYYANNPHSKDFIHSNNNTHIKSSDNRELLEPSFILKVDSEWKREWGGSNREFPYEVVVDSFDNIYVVGYSKSYEPEIGQDNVFILKYDCNGTLLWSEIWGGDDDDVAKAAIIDSSGNLYVTGYTESMSVNGRADAFLIKYNSEGTLLWSKVYKPPGDIFDLGREYAEGIALDSEENIILTGHAGSSFMLLKYNSTGSLLCSKFWVSGGCTGYKVVTDSQDYIFMLGYINNDPILMKLNNSGELEDQITCQDGEFGNIVIDSLDNIFITISESSLKHYIFRYDTNLNYISNISWIEPEGYYGYQLCLDSQNNLYVAGKYYVLMKFNQSGQCYWNFTQNEAQDPLRASYITCDSNHNIYYCASQNSDDTILLKYDNSSHQIQFLKSPKFSPRQIHALLVGIQDYPGDENDLIFPANDRRDMREHLVQNCNFPVENIEDLASSSATKQSILNKLIELKNSLNPEDGLVIQYSGHGCADPDSRFVPYDAIPYDSTKTIPYSEFYSYLDDINCTQKVVLIDACESGDFATQASGSGKITMTSCRTNEYSIETFDLYNGVFTYFFLDA
ncbi:MAG: SBBP repeat-containing protein, partial [Candidatus Hermodarchaeota archaeon]